MSNFNQQKNLKAGTYTVLLLGSLLALCFIISWTSPVLPPIQEEEGMEVNLGDSETGSGDVQPLLPGDPALETETVQTPPPQPTQTAPAEKEIETNDEDKEAPPAVVTKPKEETKPKPKAEFKPIPEAPKPVIKPKEEAKPVETPPAPKPKAIYKSATGNANGIGGNNADTYQPSKGQGIAGGSGDQGKLNGNPNSDSYTGNGGYGSGNGVSISRGLQGRKINRFPSFEDDFDENAKVAVDIKVDNNGNVTSATIQPRGTTTGNVNMKNIAIRKARQLKFNIDEDGAIEQMGTIIFSFRIRQ
jgi:outer membrane biosynthesis protein TonB